MGVLVLALALVPKLGEGSRQITSAAVRPM